MSLDTLNPQACSQQAVETRKTSVRSDSTKPAANWQEFRKGATRETPSTNLRLHLKNQRTSGQRFERVDRLVEGTTVSSKTSFATASCSTKRRQLIPNLILCSMIVSCYLLTYIAAASIIHAHSVASSPRTAAQHHQKPRHRETLHAIYVQMLANQRQQATEQDRIRDLDLTSTTSQQSLWQFEPQATGGESYPATSAGRWPPLEAGEPDLRKLELFGQHTGNGNRLPLPASADSTSSGSQFAATAPTTPTLNHQILPPAQPFYEFNFVPTNALVLEPAPRQENSKGQQQNHVVNNYNNDMVAAQRVNLSSLLAAAEAAHPQGVSLVGHSLSPSVSSAQKLDQTDKQSPSTETKTENSVEKSAETSQTKSASDVVERSIEPRQNRQKLSRLLKKAEWNNLFVKLSKVLLKHLLEMALKDIVGKQSGDTTSDSDSTTGRKKSDTQSELADLFKDFVKNAVSNM